MNWDAFKSTAASSVSAAKHAREAASARVAEEDAARRRHSAVAAAEVQPQFEIAVADFVTRMPRSARERHTGGFRAERFLYLKDWDATTELISPDVAVTIVW